MNTKRCSVCRKIKFLDEFNRDKRSSDGRISECKECTKYRKIIYRRSKIGVLNIIYSNQCESSKRRMRNPPIYTKLELKEWLFDQQLFHDLYDNWVRCGYKKMEKPSIDRLNDYKGYSFDNIQLMTWQENQDKVHSDQINGINNKVSKAVLQYDKQNNFIREYYSIMQAERKTGIFNTHISDVCMKKPHYHTAGGFIWKFKE